MAAKKTKKLCDAKKAMVSALDQFGPYDTICALASVLRQYSERIAKTDRSGIMKPALYKTAKRLNAAANEVEFWVGS